MLGISENTIVHSAAVKQPITPDSQKQVASLLLLGKKAEAVKAATMSNLWSLALIVAAQVDQATFQDTLANYATTQLTADDPLRTALLGFSGKPLSLDPTSLQETWAQHVAMLLANRGNSDHAALAQVANTLLQGRLLGPAHFCFLLSGVGLGGLEAPGACVTLLGVDHVAYPSTFYRDVFAFHLTEAFEFAQRLQASDFLIPHFQAYRLLHARLLCDFGLMKEAQRYDG